jgi:hypothetical protein
MAGQRERTKFTGVYQRKSETRRNPRDGKADICFDITHKTADGRKVWEKIGWKSEEFTAQFANEKRSERVASRSTRGGDPNTQNLP